MRRFTIPLLVAAVAIGTLGIVTIPKIVETPYYSALAFTENSTQSATIVVGGDIEVILPSDFKPDSAAFETESEGITSVGTLDASTMRIKVTGLKAGIDKFTITDGNYTFTVDIIVKDAVTYDTAISVSTGAINMSITDQSDLPKVIRKISNFDKLQGPVKVTSSSSVIAEASIDESGIITIVGKTEGKVEVTVEAPNVPFVSFIVAVYDDSKEQEIVISEETPIKIYLEDSTRKKITIENYDKLKEDVEVDVDNTDIISASISGDTVTLKALEVGKTAVTLSCEGIKDKSFVAYVYEGSSGEEEEDEDEDDEDTDSEVTEITKITIDDEDFSVAVGKSETLDVTLRPRNVATTYLRFTSEDKSIATVTTDGKVTGVKEGTTYITAFYRKDDEISDKIKVTVTKSGKVDKTDTTPIDATKLLNKIPYMLPTGTYNLSDMFGIDESRLKPVLITIVDNINDTNVMIDGELHRIQVYGATIKNTSIVFSDVPTTHWANNFITYASSKGYLTGVLGTKYQPSEKLSYGDTFMALGKVFTNNKVTVPITPRDVVDEYMASFDTTRPSYYHYKYIMSLLNGTEVARYTQPGSAMYTAGISRIHMANILYNLTYNMGFQQTNRNFTFPDVQSSVMLNFVGNTGLMIGQADGRFNPNGQLSRAELATIISRLDILMGKGYTPNTSTSTSTSPSTGTQTPSTSDEDDDTQSSTVTWS